MTTKQILRLNEVIENIDKTTYELVKNKIASKPTIIEWKRNYKMGLYKQYTSLVDGSMYYSEEISIEEQCVNLLAQEFKQMTEGTDKEKHRNKLLAFILKSNVSKVYRLYGKSSDNLLLIDYDIKEDIEVEIGRYVYMMTSSEMLQRFSKIKNNGIVSAYQFNGIELHSLSTDFIHHIANKMEYFAKHGDFESNIDEKYKFSELFARKVAKGLICNMINIAREHDIHLFEAIHSWENSLTQDEYETKYNFVSVVYYNIKGIDNLNDECKAELYEQIADGIAIMFNKYTFDNRSSLKRKLKTVVSSEKDYISGIEILKKLDEENPLMAMSIDK